MIALNERMLGAQAYRLGENIRGRLDFDLTPLTTRTLLANTLRDQQKYAEAAAEYKEVMQIEEKVLGPENFDTLDACHNFAYQLGQQRRMKEAKVFAEGAAKGALKARGANDLNTREYAKFLEELESGHAITMPEAKFREQFISRTIVSQHASR